MDNSDAVQPDSTFRVLAVTQGLWGERMAANIRDHAPADWKVEVWAAPNPIPPIVDYPEEYLTTSLPQADVVLALGEVAGLAQLVPDIARLTGARAVIAPIDRNESLPPGLARQLAGWLSDMDVSAVFPRPFCSLTEETLNRKPIVSPYDEPLIRRFARAFGQPNFQAAVEDGRIREVTVLRDTPCGCARYVAEGLPGTPVDDALEKAGMLHHHYPCLASMKQDADYHDTLMHVSGNLLRDNLKDEIEQHLALVYLRPHNLADSTPE
jgi:hypothetical protein